MKLFKYENYTLTISEEAYTIRAFRDLVKRDRSKEKVKSMQELGFIYHFADPRSDFAFIVDEGDRLDAIKEQEGLGENWIPDKKVLEALEVYKELTKTTSSLLLEDTRIAVDNTRKFLRELDLAAVDQNGKPKYNISQVISALKSIPSLVTALSDAERAIANELAQVGRMRANRAKTITEDGIDIYIEKDEDSD